MKFFSDKEYIYINIVKISIGTEVDKKIGLPLVAGNTTYSAKPREKKKVFA
jgi:hypothetical protein